MKDLRKNIDVMHSEKKWQSFARMLEEEGLSDSILMVNPPSVLLIQNK